MQAQSPEHESVLPDHVSPIPRPESRAEARLLLLCLKIGFFPTYERAGEEGESEKRDRPESTSSNGTPSNVGLGLSEAEVMARGT